MLKLPLLLLLATPAPVNFEKWLGEDVHYIISRSEIKQFNQLSSDEDRRAFVEEFWRRRDPDPTTEANPFRQEHYRRLAYANAHFAHGKPGWRTDRGRVYIIHGEPAERLVFASQEIEKRKELARGSGGGRSLPSSGGVTISIPESELWTYRELGGRDYPSGPMDVFFMRLSSADAMSLLTLKQNSPQGFLDRNRFFNSGLYRGAASAGLDFQIVYAGRPRFHSNVDFYYVLEDSPFVFDPFDLTQSVAELLRSPGDLLERQAEERLRLKRQVESALFFDELPASVEVWFLRSATPYTYIPLVIEVAGRELANVDEFTVLAEIRRNGRIVAELFDTLTLEAASQDRLPHERIVYQSRLATLPGDHQLDVYLLDQRNGRFKHIHQPLIVPSFSTGFSLSNLILCNQVRPIDGTEKPLFRQRHRALTYSDSNPLKVDQLLLVPALERRFRRKDLLTAFFEIYQPRLRANRPKVEILIRILKKGQPIATPTLRQLQYVTHDELVKVSYAISLSLSRLSRGHYQLQVEARDLLSSDKQVQEVDFDVL
ncbi:MAG: GWxTD domain-containing protein [Acidobacteriota bacterium]